MEKYILEGFYLYHGAPNGKGRLSGEIEISDKGTFEGEVEDYESRVPQQFIKGHVKQERELTKLLFLKFPPATNLANLAYSLQKDNGAHWNGKYKGRWGSNAI